jgi:hypothetical protein
VASYDVRVTSASVSQGFGDWSRPAAWQGLTSTQKAFSLPQGVTRCLSVRARDNVGNVGAWSAARCATGAVDERALPRAGEWTTVRSASLLGGYGLRTSRLGDEVWSPYTTVRRVGVVASTCPTCGTVGVYVGDVLVGRLSLTSSVLKHQQVRALALPSTRSGVVSLRVLTSGRPVLVDGLLVSRV